MRTLAALCFAALLACPAQPAHATGSLGIVATTPALGGIYGTLWALPQLNFDARLTLATADLGVGTGIPLGTNGGQHSIVFSLLGGYVHDLVTTSWLPVRGWHGAATVGYGWLSNWDLRALVGLDVGQGRLGQAVPGFTASILFGRVI